MVDLRVRIAGVGEDDLTHWFIIDLVDPFTSQVLDRDRFRWAKGTKRILTNPPPDPANPPPDFVPILGPPIEANKFDYAEALTIAARHFLRRQGLLQRRPGLAWTPVTLNRLSGQPVARGDPNSDKLARMRGAEALVGDPAITGTIRRRQFGSGTVTTISADFDGDSRDDIPSCITSGNLRVGVNVLGQDFRTYIRFPLGSLPATDTITNVDLIVNRVTGFGVDILADIQAYNTNGQADPSPDTCATRRTRCADDATPYVDDTTVFQGLNGIRTIDLGANADADVEAAKDGVNRFAIGLNENTAGNNNFFTMEGLEDAGTDEPKLEITHSAAAAADEIGAPGSTVWAMNRQVLILPY